MLEIVNARRTTDGRRLDGNTISSPCEPNGSGELIITPSLRISPLLLVQSHPKALQLTVPRILYLLLSNHMVSFSGDCLS